MTPPRDAITAALMAAAAAMIVAAYVFAALPRGPARCAPGRLVRLAATEEDTGSWPVAYVATPKGARMAKLPRGHGLLAGQEVGIVTTPVLFGETLSVRRDCAGSG